MWQISVIFSLIFNSVLSQVPETPVVNIVQGEVVGSVSTHGNFYEFHGIPYADSTSGSHRFQAPSPPPTFQDTFIANRNDIRCVRALGVGYEGTEDCLVANVFTPSVNSSSRLSVMVWIKGREFDRAYENEYSFKNIIEQNVVVVTLNYRESILGFLCLGTETAPGNAGLKDIIAGLRWVQENIVQFGGNPDDITLFGHGSGGAAIDLITMSPLATGLVQKAIAQSGNAFAPWAVTRDNLAFAVQVAEALGHVVTNIQELSNVFTRTSVAALMAVINELDLTDNSLAFAPCLERDDIEGVQPFLTKSPYHTIADGEQLQIPFIMGYVDNEGTIRAEEALHYGWLERMENSFIEFIQPDLEFENEEQEAEVAAEIKTFYFRDGTVSLTNIDDYISYHGDTMMLVSTIREARMRALTSSLPVYLYQFSYKGSLGEAFAGPLDVESAAHSEELAYLFYDTPNENTPLLDLTVGDILVERWTNFAKTGIPLSEISRVPWRPYTSDNSYYLRVLDNVEVNEDEGTIELELENPQPETISFWDSIYDEHFLDAEGKWELTDRNDEDEENVVEDSDEDDNVEDGGIEGEPIIDEDGDDDEDVPDSASAVIGHTLPILILFSLLNKFHLDKMLS